MRNTRDQAPKDVIDPRIELHRKLEEAEADVRAGDRGITVAAMRRKLRR